jgi:hypothetical protein
VFLIRNFKNGFSVAHVQEIIGNLILNKTESFFTAHVTEAINRFFTALPIEEHKHSYDFLRDKLIQKTRSSKHIFIPYTMALYLRLDFILIA